MVYPVNARRLLPEYDNDSTVAAWTQCSSNPLGAIEMDCFLPAAKLNCTATSKRRIPTLNVIEYPPNCSISDFFNASPAWFLIRIV